MKLLWTLTALPIAAFVACSSSGDDESIRKGPETNVPGLDHAPVELRRESATPRRLSTDQWRASFPVLFGNNTKGKPITWNNGNNVALDNPGISRALGEPDYINTTTEALEPSLMYTKFTNDAARNICEQAVEADVDRTDVATRVLLRKVSFTDTLQNNPEAVNDNLRYLKLRFHGTYIASADVTQLAPLRDLFSASYAGSPETTPEAKARDAWLAVCVGLVVSPEFHVY